MVLSSFLPVKVTQMVTDRIEEKLQKKSSCNIYKCSKMLPSDRLNRYGTILSDLTEPFKYYTNLDKYDNRHECMQFTPNLIQTNTFDIPLPNAHLTNIESELRGLGRPLSRIPGQQQIRRVQNFDANQIECVQKIIYNR